MTKLAFTEELTGWDVTCPYNKDVSYFMGRLEEGSNGWTYSGVDMPMNLEGLDQIRHKLANLEATRLAKIELNQLKEKTDE